MPNKLILSENQKQTAVTQQGIESKNNYRQNKTFSRPQFIVPHHYFVTHFNILTISTVKWELVWVNQSGTHFVGNKIRFKLDILNDWLCWFDGHVITSLDGIDLKINLLRLHWRLFSYFQNTIFSMFSINWLTFEFSSNDLDANHLLEKVFIFFIRSPHLNCIRIKTIFPKLINLIMYSKPLPIRWIQ